MTASAVKFVAISFSFPRTRTTPSNNQRLCWYGLLVSIKVFLIATSE
jgi:hypothetical protein